LRARAGYDPAGPGERLDDGNERQRHEKLVGREALLARLESQDGEGVMPWQLVHGSQHRTVRRSATAGR